MKRILFVIYTLLLALPHTGLQAQSNIDQVLKSIEQNNKELQANAQSVASQKLEAKTANNLPDPTLSYAHLWGSKDKSETIGELVVSQSFDFPSLYATRRKLNQLKSNMLDNQTDIARQALLLQAKELCLDIIMLRQQKQILNERRKNAEELSEAYAVRLNAGEASSLETNKIKLELMNVKTEATLNESNLQNKCLALQALNGNIPVSFEESEYPSAPLPKDFQQLKSEVICSDRTLMDFDNQALVARKQISVDKSQWLPKLELGYRRNTESGTPFNGVVVGFSFPLFENRNKVKIAKMQASSINLQKEGAALQIESELAQLYREAQSLQEAMKEYQETFQSQRNIEYLKRALDGGEINIIEYFLETSVVYQSHLNYIQLENQYQKVMAKIYRNRL